MFKKFKTIFLISLLPILLSISSLFADCTKTDIAKLVSSFTDIYKDQDRLALLNASTHALIDSAINNMVALAQHKQGAKVMKNIISLCLNKKKGFDKKYLKKFITKIDTNFVEICKAPYGISILCALVAGNDPNENYYKSKNELRYVYFLNLIKNLSRLLENSIFLNHKKIAKLIDNLICYLDFHMIKKLKRVSEKPIQEILTSNNTYPLTTSKFLIRILMAVLDLEKPELQQLYVKFLIKNGFVFEHNFAAYEISKFSDSQAVNYFVNYIIENIVRATTKRDIVGFIIKFIKKNNDYKQLMLQKINENLVSIIQSPYGYLMLEEFAYNSEMIAKLEKITVENIETVHPKIVLLINENSRNAIPLKKALKHYIRKKKTVDGLVKIWIYNASCVDDSEKIIYKSVSPTEDHLKHFNPKDSQYYYNSLPDLLDTLKEYQKDSLLQTMVLQVIEKEKELHEKYYTVIHGQRLHYLFFEQLHTFLYKVFNSVGIDDFLYLHIKDLKPAPEQIKKEKQQRKALLNRGRETNNDRKKLLFTNRAFFGNLSNLGSCSASYIASNSNIKNVDFTLKKVFSINNCEKLYHTYKSVLKVLYKKFIAISSYGACILIAIPKETVQKQIYLAYPGGYKKSIRLKDIFGISWPWGWTSDAKYVFDLLHNNPSRIIDNIDKLEFCVPMTTDRFGGLNPHSGIKMFPFVAADQEKLARYYKEQQEIFEQIKKDIEGQMVVENI